ncbi:hypothetical protein ASB58_17745 [Pseudomonas abyssi]|uniref:diguanylate cyclase n=1 Tax=Pseudomonas abyssi TaxID=170540 RepID=A0A395QY98_9PSED|nr:hypothetical protein ASB58_17745 [Halopseudomonas gallaeciensis]
MVCALAKSPVHNLSRYYLVLMLLGSATFLLVVALTVWIGWKKQESVEISLAKQRVHEMALHLRTNLRAADDAVAQLAVWSNGFAHQVPYAGSSGLRRAVQQAMQSSDDGEFTLDALSALPAQDRLGQILGLSSIQATGTANGASHLDLALSLLDRLGTGQATSPFLRWTYFYTAGEDMLAISPWTPSQVLLGEHNGVRDFLHSSWQYYDVARMALPAQNPQRERFWTPAYVDQAGAGLMVSLGQPVYWDEHFVGVVAVDVLLSFLQGELDSFPDESGRLIIANQYGQVLADRSNLHTGRSAVPQLSSVLPDMPGQGDSLKALDGTHQDNHWLLLDKLDSPEWLVLFLLPREVVTTRVLAAFMPQLQLALVLVIGVALANFVLWRVLVHPTMRVADYVAHTTDEVAPPTPEVPLVWRPWVEGMVQAFVERRRLLNELEQANAQLERKVAVRTQELLTANKQLARQANTDPLTGAFNRRYLFDLLSKEAARVRRGAAAMSVLLIDLDHFKRINDNYGHDAGDAVLREFVQRACAAVRTTDQICRYGGEEFVAFLPECSIEGALALAERMRLSIALTAFEHDGQNIPVTASIGIAQFMATDTEHTLLKRADQALYRAKETGRNRCVLSD